MKDGAGKSLSIDEVFKKILNRISNIFLEFEIMLLRWVGNIPSHLLRRFFYRLAGIRIGKGSTIHMWANFFDPKGISIGNDSIIGDRIMLDGRNIIRIGDHVGIASEVMIYNSEHDIHSENFVAIDAPVIIEDYVFIGPRAIILPGVTIRMGGIVAAGAVVTKDVEQYSIVGGVPAKVIGERKDKKLNYKLGRSRWFR
ncbi:hypothetical protein LBMAG33_1650 [Candidatus Levyibacteriota bacterium]|nr:acyltransferase [Candidatus Levybacteria bacterium]GDX61855.1 hypothetical protein LBMAG33_1650 [Candidatus Levybacteria bacterium]